MRHSTQHSFVKPYPILFCIKSTLASIMMNGISLEKKLPVFFYFGTESTRMKHIIIFLWSISSNWNKMEKFKYHMSLSLRKTRSVRNLRLALLSNHSNKYKQWLLVVKILQMRPKNLWNLIKKKLILSLSGLWNWKIKTFIIQQFRIVLTWMKKRNHD